MTKWKSGIRTVLSIALAVCLVLSLSVGAFADSEDTDLNYFSPTFTSAMDYTMSEWYEGDYSRALLTLFLALDLSNEVSDTEFAFADTMSEKTYIGKSSDMLGVYLHGVSEDYVVFYYPGPDLAAYITVDKMTDAMVELVLPQVFDDSYTNDTEDIVTVAKVVQEVLES